MAETTDALVLDLVEWIAREPRPYAEVLEVWRTSSGRRLLRARLSSRSMDMPLPF